MVPKIVEAQYRKDYRIWVRFADQVEGEVDLEGDLWGEVFESLRDKSEFKNSGWIGSWKLLSGQTARILPRNSCMQSCGPTTRLNQTPRLAWPSRMLGLRSQPIPHYLQPLFLFLLLL